MTKKIYGIYLAYSKCDSSQKELYMDSPTDYPSELAKVVRYNDRATQFAEYVNSCGAVAQLVTSDSRRQFNKKIAEMKKNFNNPEWVKVNIDPYY